MILWLSRSRRMGRIAPPLFPLEMFRNISIHQEAQLPTRFCLSLRLPGGSLRLVDNVIVIASVELFLGGDQG